jgi:glycosyl transferase, family 25
MDIDLYSINLDRSVDRWERISHRAATLKLPIVRVSGVDGVNMPVKDFVDCDMTKFERNNGRKMLAGEYGCYRSHLSALRTFLASGSSAAIIVEDDIELIPDLILRAHHALEAVPNADVIKFCNHRIVGFCRAAKSASGDDIGRATHGPLGSSACYVVTRLGAQRLVDGIKVMEYPLDIALERGWASGAEVYTTRYNVTSPRKEGSTIATREIYRSVKFHWSRRFRTYGVRILEALRRLQYALSG